MGLVIAPPLSALPVAASPDSTTSAPQGAGTTDTAVTDTFAVLLAMLAQGAATVSAPAKSLATMAAALPVGAPADAKPDGATSKDSPLAAALAVATLLPLPAAAAPSVPESTTGADGATNASPHITTPSAAAAPLTASLPSVVPMAGTDTPTLPAASDPSASPLPASLPSVVPGAGTDTPTPPAASDPSASPDGNTAIAAIISAAPQSSAAISSAPTLAWAAGAATASIAVQQPPPPSEAAIPVPLDVGSATKPPAAVQPPGTNAPQGVEISVVRSVGNAKQTQTAGDSTQGGANSGQKQEAASSTPEAQSASSAIAVAPTLPNSSPAPTASAAQAAPPVHAAPQPVEQVARAVIDSAEHGGGEVHIRLDPPELGAVTIHVRIDGNRVQVQVQAERNEAMNLLRQSTIDLSSLLGSRGLNLTDVNVGLGGRQAPGGEQTSTNQNAGSSNGEFASILGVDETPPTELHNRLQSAYNPDGLHIYRV